MISRSSKFFSVFLFTCFVTTWCGAAAQEPTSVELESAKEEVRGLGGKPEAECWHVMSFEDLLQQPNAIFDGDYLIFWLMRLDFFDEAIALIKAGADVTHLSLKDGQSIYEVFRSSSAVRQRSQNMTRFAAGPAFQGQGLVLLLGMGGFLVLQDLIDYQFIGALRRAIDNENIAEFKWLCVVLNHGSHGGAGSHLVSVFTQPIEKDGMRLVDYAKERGWMEHVRSVIK